MLTHSSLTTYEHPAILLRALAHPIRLAVVEWLFREGRSAVSSLESGLDLDPSVLAHHLKILRRQDVIRVHRQGRETTYCLSHPDFFRLVDLVKRPIR